MSNNIIVITGASSGMGREFAMQLDRGLSSVDEFWLVARRIGRMKEMAEKMRHRVKILPLDLTNEGDLDILKESLLEEKPAVRMLINCAGYGMMGDVEQIPQKEQAGQVDLNCRALVEVTQLCLPYMKKKSRIIQLASSAAFLPQPGFAVYAATKSFVLSFSRALRAELKQSADLCDDRMPGPCADGIFRGGRAVRLHPRDQKIYDGRSRAGCKGSAAGELQKQADVRMQPADAAFLGGNAPAAAGRDALGSSEDAEERK
ncbi:MAG: SDR family NAD(P)-dependent oxidoreductase [Eisenbergiella sp.]